MGRIARIVIPNYPHHVTNRGNRGDPVFFTTEDKERYLSLFLEFSRRWGLDIGAYCLMDNHVHFMAVPRHADSLARTMGVTQMRYAQLVNKHQGWRGHLWASRFFSTPLDSNHFQAAVRYIELNPVRAGLVERAEDYYWSSARAHIQRQNNLLLSKDALFGLEDLVGDWSNWLSEGNTDTELEMLRKCTRTGRPCGSKSFVSIVKKVTGRDPMKATGEQKKKEAGPPDLG